MKIKSNMLALGIGGANVILCALYFSFKAAPWFALGILLTITSIVVFMQTENWLTHDATEFENRFWTMVAMIVSFVLFFAVDSPLSFVSRSPSLAWLLVGIVTFLAHNYHRHLTRIVLSRVPNMKRVTSADFSILEHRVKAKEMLAEIRSLILSIDRPFISSTFLNLFSLARVLYAERRIISIFEEAGPEQLNFLVLNVQLGLLLYKIKDHRYARQFHRTKLLTLLAVNRVTELSSASRAMLLDGFQRMKLSAHPQAEQWAQSIILKTKGDNLSELKSLTDCKGDFNSMHKLIYWDVRNAAVKSEILKHIETQAKVQASHMILRTKAARLRDKFAWRKILSDVDDTLSCSGGAFPAGCDVSFPKKCIYPGVLAFYRELDLGTTGPDHWESDKRIGNLVFLSARPHLYKDLLESHSYEKFRRLQDTAGMHTSPSLLPGEMVSGTEFFVSGSMEPIARKKYDNFREYLSLYPEFECVFIGDNGQGDVRASEMLMTLEGGKFASNLKRSYIHEVLPLHLTYTATSSTRSRGNANIFYFMTYIEAALDAYKHGLIRLHGLRAVVEDAKADFLRISDESWSTAEGAAAVEAELKAKQLLAAIRTQRPEKKAGGQSTKDGDAADGDGATGPSYEEVLSKLPRLKKGHASGFKGAHSPGWKRELRLRELNSAIAQVNLTLSSLARAAGTVTNSTPTRTSNTSSAIDPVLLTPLRPLSVPCRYPVGNVVRTEYGLGIVHWFRPQDGVYEVLVHWGAHSDELNVDACLDRVSRLTEDRRADDALSSRSLSYESTGDTPFQLTGSPVADRSSLVSLAPSKSTRGFTPPCLGGSFIKVMATAANLGPAPSGAPAYMSSTPRARTETIWKSVTGLLRSGGRSKKHHPRSGRRRSVAGLIEMKPVDSRGGDVCASAPSTTTTTTFASEVILGEVAVENVTDKGLDAFPTADSVDPAPAVTTAVTTSASGAPPASKPHSGMLSLISTIWRGRGGTAVGTADSGAVASDEHDYLEEYYDCLVWTPYGTGHVVYIHPADPKSGRPGDHVDAFSEDMVIVELHWGPICSIRRRNTTIIAGSVKGVRVGIGGYPLPTYKSPNPTVSIPRKESDSKVDSDKSSSAIASFIRYSPHGKRSGDSVGSPSSNRVRASTDGQVDVCGRDSLGDEPSSAVKLDGYFGSSFEGSPLIARPRRSMSVENDANPMTLPPIEVPTAISAPTMERTRANTVDSPRNLVPGTVPVWPSQSAPAIAEERPLGYRARLLTDWLFSLRGNAESGVTPEVGIHLASSSSHKDKDGLRDDEDRSRLGIIANNHVESAPELDVSMQSDSSTGSVDSDAARKCSFNEGHDPLSF